MSKVKLPAYLKWRNGKPRWEPGPGLRKEGWKGVDLKYEDTSRLGKYMDLPDAIRAAELQNEKIKSWRQGHKTAENTKPVTKHSINALFQKYYQSDMFLSKSPATQKDYRGKAKIFIDLFGNDSVNDFTKPVIFQFWERAKEVKGHHMANGMIAVVRRVFSYAELIGWIKENSNPALKLSLPQPEARLVLFEPDEIGSPS